MGSCSLHLLDIHPCDTCHFSAAFIHNNNEKTDSIDHADRMLVRLCNAHRWLWRPLSRLVWRRAQSHGIWFSVESKPSDDWATVRWNLAILEAALASACCEYCASNRCEVVLYVLRHLNAHVIDSGRSSRFDDLMHNNVLEQFDRVRVLCSDLALPFCTAVPCVS